MAGGGPAVGTDRRPALRGRSGPGAGVGLPAPGDTRSDAMGGNGRGGASFLSSVRRPTCKPSELRPSPLGRMCTPALGDYAHGLGGGSRAIRSVPPLVLVPRRGAEGPRRGGRGRRRAGVASLRSVASAWRAGSFGIRHRSPSRPGDAPPLTPYLPRAPGVAQVEDRGTRGADPGGPSAARVRVVVGASGGNRGGSGEVPITFRPLPRTLNVHGGEAWARRLLTVGAHVIPPAPDLPAIEPPLCPPPYPPP
jgi:hypothetical protein